MIEISLGQRLHELRDSADLSLRELAKKVGISGTFLSDIELGRRFPSEEILGKLASALVGRRLTSARDTPTPTFWRSSQGAIPALQTGFGVECGVFTLKATQTFTVLERWAFLA